MKIAVVPQYPQALNNTIFKHDEFAPLQLYGVDRLGFAAVKERSEAKRDIMATVDRFEINEIDTCLLIDINYYYLIEFPRSEYSRN